MSRKLASIVEIGKLYPIEGADKIEVAIPKGKGWKIVVGKGDFKVCDLAVFFEIDSALDPNDERYAFLRERCLRKFVSKSGNVLREVIKIKSIKLRGVVSQGLLMPIGKFPELNPLLTEKCGGDGAVWEFRMDSDGISRIYILSDKLSDSEGKMKVAATQRASVCRGVPLPQDKVVGADVTSLLHVEHYDEIKEQLQPAMGNPLAGDTKGTFPSAWIPKSDEDRIQGCADYFEKYKGVSFEITAKDDGSSETMAYSPTIDAEDPFIVCSRNLRLKRPQGEDTVSAFWQVVNEYDLENKLRDFFESTGKEYAVQGELVGCGINANRDKYNSFEFHVFRIWDIKEQKFVSPEERREFCEKRNIPHVQILETHYPFFDRVTTMDDALKFAEGKTLRGNEREGVVCKQDDGNGDLHFKIVSNRYLLKQQD